MTCKELQDTFSKHLEESLVLNGHVKTVRDSKNILFIELNDGTSSLNNIQLVVKKTEVSDLPTLSINSSISIKGVVISTPNREQSFEIQVKEINLINFAKDTYPLQKKEQTLEFLRTKQEYRSSTKYFNTVFRLKAEIVKQAMSFLDSKGFMWIHTPIITTNDSEGGGEVFEVKSEIDNYFPKNAYLAVSGQLGAEALAQSFNKVYAFGPTFRSEKSDTPQHTSEFWMLEPEVSFCNHEEAILIGINLLSFVSKKLLLNFEAELTYLSKVNEMDLLTHASKLSKKSHQQLTYQEALSILNKNMEECHLTFGDDLSKEHEKFLCKHFDSLVILTNFPLKTSPFYMYDNGDKTSRSFDFLLDGVGEVIGGSQREDRFSNLEEVIKKKDNPELLKWYLDLRKHGFAPSSGFGLGVDRLVMYLLGVKNIRDVQFFPRTYKSISF